MLGPPSLLPQELLPSRAALLAVRVPCPTLPRVVALLRAAPRCPAAARAALLLAQPHCGLPCCCACCAAARAALLAARVPCPSQRYRADLPCMPRTPCCHARTARPAALVPRTPCSPAPVRALLPRTRARPAAQRQHVPHCPALAVATATTAATAAFAAAATPTALATATAAVTTAMSTPTMLALDAEGRSLGSTEGGDPAAADIATSRRSLRLETPPGFPTRASSPPLQPVAVDFRGPGVVGGGDAEGSRSGGAGSGGAGSRGADSGGARSPLVGGVGGTGAGGAGSGGAFQSLPRRTIFFEQPSSSLPKPTPTCTTSPLLFPVPDSPLPAPARYSPLPVSLTGRRVPVSCAASPATSRVTWEPVVLPLHPPSSLPAVPDPVSNLARVPSPTVPRCLGALVIAHASSTAAASALVAELAGFAATRRRAYLEGLVSSSSCPPSVEGDLALGCDVLEDRQFELEYLPYPLRIRTHYVAPEETPPCAFAGCWEGAVLLGQTREQNVALGTSFLCRTSVEAAFPYSPFVCGHTGQHC
ncbi:unnamed protein product [Closterium sp. NIES-54]